MSTFDFSSINRLTSLSPTLSRTSSFEIPIAQFGLVVGETSCKLSVFRGADEIEIPIMFIKVISGTIHVREADTTQMLTFINKLRNGDDCNYTISDPMIRFTVTSNVITMRTNLLKEFNIKNDKASRESLADALEQLHQLRVKSPRIAL